MHDDVNEKCRRDESQVVYKISKEWGEEECTQKPIIKSFKKEGKRRVGLPSTPSKKSQTSFYSNHLELELILNIASYVQYIHIIGLPK